MYFISRSRLRGWVRQGTQTVGQLNARKRRRKNCFLVSGWWQEGRGVKNPPQQVGEAQVFARF